MPLPTELSTSEQEPSRPNLESGAQVPLPKEPNAMQQSHRERQMPSASFLPETGVANEAAKSSRAASCHWSSDEDKKILRLFEDLDKSWSQYPAHFSNRNARSISVRFCSLRKEILDKFSGSSLLERYSNYEAAGRGKKKAKWTKHKEEVLTQILETDGKNWPLMWGELDGKRSIAAIKSHLHALSKKETEKVPQSLAVPKRPDSRVLSVEQPPSANPPARLDIAVSKDTHHIADFPAIQQPPSPAAESELEGDAAMSIEKPLSDQSMKAAPGSAFESKDQQEERLAVHNFYANAAVNSTRSESDQLTEARRKNLALRWARHQNSAQANQRESEEEPKTSPAASFSKASVDFRKYNPIVQAILRTIMVSAWSKSANSSLPAEMICSLEERGSEQNGRAAASVMVILEFAAETFRRPFSSFSFEQNEKNVSALVDKGLLEVLSEATRDGEARKSCFILAQFVQQTFDHLASQETELEWISFFANQFLGPLFDWTEEGSYRGSFKKKLESVCVHALAQCSGYMVDHCSPMYVRGHELCMAICDVHAAIIQKLPQTTKDSLSANSSMFATLEVMAFTITDLANLLIEE